MNRGDWREYERRLRLRQRRRREVELAAGWHREPVPTDRSLCRLDDDERMTEFANMREFTINGRRP